MKVLFLSFACLLILIRVAPAQSGDKFLPDNANIKWLFDTRTGKDDTPLSKAYLMIGERKVKARDDEAMGQYHVVERQDYKSRKIPAAALAACSIWWAGQGQDLYVIRRRRNQLIVYIRFLDEGVSKIPPYKRLKMIRLP